MEKAAMIKIAMQILFLFWIVAFSRDTFAAKTNQAVYEDPFDQAAGGASLTRATQSAALFANPALLRYGGEFHRWFGSTFHFLVNQESIETVRSLSKGGEGDQGSAVAEAALNTPVRVGWASTIGYLNTYGGFQVFSRFEPDVRGRRYGETGLPEIELQTESYNGAILGFSLPTPVRWLSLGVSAKYLMANEKSESFEVSDLEAMSGLATTAVEGFSSLNTGIGKDVGALLFFQGRTLDLRLAYKIDDVGGTALSGSQEFSEIKQVSSAGVGVTWHSAYNALHLSLDVRDLNGAYEEELFKRTYYGAKLLLAEYIGLAYGYYQGYPCYGIEMDIILMRLTLASLGRELGRGPETEARRMYTFGFAIGF